MEIRVLRYFLMVAREENITKAAELLHITPVSYTHLDVYKRQTQKHAQYFYSFFKGRKDVYSKRAGKPNPKTGKTGYYTQCWNYWKPGICPKYEKKKIKCADCPEPVSYTHLKCAQQNRKKEQQKLFPDNSFCNFVFCLMYCFHKIPLLSCNSVIFLTELISICIIISVQGKSNTI